MQNVGTVDVLVIGAGQAGLSAGHHLRRRGFVPLDEAGPSSRTFTMLDGNASPGGAWQHRWNSLTMATVNNIFDLPGAPVPPVDPDARANDVLPRYFADYERQFRLRVQRPVTVRRVERDPGADLLQIVTDRGVWRARYVINATGTWTQPYWPLYPGQRTFRGRQLHVHDYVSAQEFAGQRVVIVGAGVSATQLLEEISRVADTFWVTRHEPRWVEATADRLADSVRQVDARTRLGLPPASVVSATGMVRAPWVVEAERRGVLVRHPMFTRIEPEGVRMPDGRLERADVIVWATGFRPALRHLAPLALRTPAGGIRVEHSRSVDEPRLFLIGYGPSQSTVGANRAGREAVAAIATELGRLSDQRPHHS